MNIENASNIFQYRLVGVLSNSAGYTTQNILEAKSDCFVRNSFRQIKITKMEIIFFFLEGLTLCLFFLYASLSTFSLSEKVRILNVIQKSSKKMSKQKTGDFFSHHIDV